MMSNESASHVVAGRDCAGVSDDEAPCGEEEQEIWICREVSRNGSHSWDWTKHQSVSLALRV